MSNYFLLELDTTPPDIEIYAPSYTAIDTLTEIRVVANEELAQYQEIYFIDSMGVRYDFTFLYNVNEYIGEVAFNQVNLGIGVLYARVMDTVHNVSKLASVPIEIISRNILSINDNTITRDMDVKVSTCGVDIGHKTTTLNEDIMQRVIDTDQTVRDIDIKLEVVK